jgi:hypothetical protein
LINPSEEDLFSIHPQPHLIGEVNHLECWHNKITKIQIVILDNYGEKVKKKHNYSRLPEKAIEPILGPKKKKKLSGLKSNSNNNGQNK